MWNPSCWSSGHRWKPQCRGGRVSKRLDRLLRNGPSCAGAQGTTLLAPRKAGPPFPLPPAPYPAHSARFHHKNLLTHRNDPSQPLSRPDRLQVYPKLLQSRSYEKTRRDYDEQDHQDVRLGGVSFYQPANASAPSSHRYQRVSTHESTSPQHLPPPPCPYQSPPRQ